MFKKKKKWFSFITRLSIFSKSSDLKSIFIDIGYWLEHHYLSWENCDVLLFWWCHQKFCFYFTIFFPDKKRIFWLDRFSCLMEHFIFRNPWFREKRHHPVLVELPWNKGTHGCHSRIDLNQQRIIGLGYVWNCHV